MKLGISTACYYPLMTEKALASVVEGGAPCTEIFINSSSELAPEFLRELRSILAGGQTAVTSLHPFTCGVEPMLFFGDYPRRFEDGLEFYKRYFEATAALGGRYFVLHGAFYKRGLIITNEQYAESYERLHQTAKGFGIRLAQENVGRCMSRDPQLFRILRKRIPDAAFVLDIKQTFRSDNTLSDFMDAMGDNVAHIHFSDAAEGRDCLPVGEGSFNFIKFFRRLEKNSYGGDAVLELYKHNYTDEKQLWDSLKRLNGMLKSERISL